MKICFTFHAERQMIERRISKEQVLEAVTNPSQIISQEQGISIFQILYREGEKDYLLRVVVKFQGNTMVILTAYRTSKIKKYWRENL